MSEPQPGDFALTKISGATGVAIAAAQRLIGTPAPVQHAMLYVGNGMVVQAMPGGAELIPLAEANAVYAWSTGKIPLNATQREWIVYSANALVGTPYSYLDYLSIGLSRWHVRPEFIRDYVSDTRHMICSQLVDYAYECAGVNLFSDGRFPGDVTPADLWRLVARA